MISKIAAPIGKRFKGLPIDIISLRENLDRLGKYQGKEDIDFFDRSLEQALKSFQQDEGLQTDGIMRPGGETERALNRILSGRKNAFGSKAAAKIKISQPIGNNNKIKEKDVEQVQRALATLDYIPKSRGFEPSGILDAMTLRGIQEFQRHNGLRIDGRLNPGGETENALNLALQNVADSDIDPQMERDPDAWDWFPPEWET